MQRRALQAAIALIEDFHLSDSTGKLFWLWHAAYFIIEAGVCLMASVLAELETEAAFPGSSHLNPENANTVLCCMQKIPLMLQKVSRRWAKVAHHASALETVSHLVMTQWTQWSDGNTFWNAEIHTIREKLANLSLFSPFSASSIPLTARRETAPAATVLPNYVPNFPTGSTPSIQPVAAQYPSMRDPATNLDQMLPLWDYDPTTQNSGEPYGFMANEAFMWDFSGLQDDEILAAMLEGSEELLLDDTVNVNYHV